MSWLLSLIAVVSAGHWVTVDATCSWKLFPKTNILGGTTKAAGTLEACQSVCQASPGCQSLDWNPAKNWCWLLNTQTGKQTTEDIDHYDYVCTENKNTWLVWIRTGKQPFSGTDANVFMVVYGKNKLDESVKSDVIQLDNEEDNFEVGQVDKFKVQTIAIGRPYKIRIGHDNSNLAADWMLDKVEMVNMATKKRYTFNCGRWLSKDEDDGSIVRELPAEGDDINQPEKVMKYSISVFTGNKPGAGTDANVFINIFGEQGDTGERPLEKSSTHLDKFERGKTDEFIIEAVNLRKLTKIRIGHDDKNLESSWFLDRVIVKPVDDPMMTAVFACNRWLDKKQGDGAIVLELTST